jgi:glyoxylase-like metal-dependent hydrolase (beta-lactamase superfamily II)
MTMISGRRSLVRGRVTEPGEFLELSAESLRSLVAKDAELSEIFMRAFILRRLELIRTGQGNVILMGSRHSANALRLREFLTRNEHPYTYIDLDTDKTSQELLDRFDVKLDEIPVVICSARSVLRNPSIQELAECLGLNSAIDETQVRDLIIVGAGPSGLAAAVYAASEGLDVLVIETATPGGQAGSSSKIENYLGFPTGISGQELAARAIAQSEKFGAKMMVAHSVARLDCEKRPYKVVLDNGNRLPACAVIIATGAQYNKPRIANLEFVVNTHFHWDHYQGNEAYPSSWPAGVEIISSEATRTSIEQRGIPRVKHEIMTMPAQIEQLKVDLQKASTPEQRDSIQKNISEAETYLTELKSMQITLPTMTFDRSLILHRKSRTVEILWLGRAHTDGDVFAFLPKEKVLVTGDALHGWTPYMGDSYPYDWIKTLDVAEKLDFDYVIAGHGDVMRGKETFELWKQYFRDLLEQTAAAYADGATLDQAKNRVCDYLISKYATKFDPKFSQSVGSNVIKACQVIAFAP